MLGVVAASVERIEVGATRRIKVYLELDFPNFANADELAERLGLHLFQYVRQEQPRDIDESETLSSLLPEERVLARMPELSGDRPSGEHLEAGAEAQRKLSAGCRPLVLHPSVLDPYLAP